MATVARRAFPASMKRSHRMSFDHCQGKHAHTHTNTADQHYLELVLEMRFQTPGRMGDKTSKTRPKPPYHSRVRFSHQLFTDVIYIRVEHYNRPNGWPCHGTTSTRRDRALRSRPKTRGSCSLSPSAIGARC
eukprot:7718264-Pyramimonas_sp.AAC.1